MKNVQLLKISGMLAGGIAALCCLVMLAACQTVNVNEYYEGDSPETVKAKAAAATVTSGGARPAWTSDPYKKYNKATDVAAVGMGSSAAMAEKDATGKLIAQFGQSIRVEERVAETYNEAVSKGVTTIFSNTSIDNTIVSSASMDSLVGAEIGDRWDDAKGTYYAVAVMNKAKSIPIYKGKIDSNNTLIDTLITIPAAQRNTLESFARYQFAATLADINVSYANLLEFIGSPVHGLKTGNDYRIEAREITKTIPIGITVKGDKSSRIESAFRDAVSSLGFQSGGANTRYVLSVTVNAQEATFANQQANTKYSRIDVTANLTDTTTRNVLVPYNFDLREGHSTLSEAENRAYTKAAEKVKAEFREDLSEYLSVLLPSK